jgi:hypothetical protein
LHLAGHTGRSNYGRHIVHEVDEEEGLVVAERQYEGSLLELLAQLDLFPTVPKS